MKAFAPPSRLEPVLFVPVMDNYGGIERNFIALSAEIHRRGGQATLLCFRCRADLQAYSDHPLRIVTLTESENPFVRARVLAGWLRQESARTGLLPLLFGIKAAFYMGIDCRAPFFLHFTDPPSLLSGKRSARGWAGRLRDAGAHFFTARGVRRCREMITMTRRNAAELAALYGRAAVVEFQGGNPPPAGFQRQPARPDAPLMVLSACRVEPSKRIDWILRAVQAYNRRGHPGPAARAVIVGRGSASRELQAEAAALGLGDAVEFPGEIPQDRLEQFFAQSSLFAMPAIQGFGLPALEALYRGVPVVTHRDSGVAEALEGEKMAIVCEGDEDVFAEGLARGLQAVYRGSFPAVPTTTLPTEAGWSEAIARRCEWLK